MSIIKLPLNYQGSQGEKMLYTLFDSEASFSCINADYLDGLEKLNRLFKPKEVETASEGHYVKITHRCHP